MAESLDDDDAIAGRRRWQQSYIDGLRITDTAAVVAAVFVAHMVRFGAEDMGVAFDPLTFTYNYEFVSLVLAMGWLALLAIFRTRSPRVIGTGVEEYRRIVSATFKLFGAVAILALGLQLDLARGYFAIALPLGLVLLLVGRWVWRVRLARIRSTGGGYRTSVLVIGSRDSSAALVKSFQDCPSAGYAVVGVCHPGAPGGIGGRLQVDDTTVPVYGNETDVLKAIEFSGADTVAVTATEHLGHRGLRNLVWDLESKQIDLVVAPGVVDVAGPRLHMRPVAGLPLIHVEKPQYNGANRFAKRGFDIAFSAAALLFIAPVFLFIAAAIKTTSSGPVFFRQERIGLDGKPFQMIKFRTMVDGADRMLAGLLDSNESDGGVLFKMKDDPRITSVGKYLRKFSLDELPQFLNVLKRDMSVVGPRPPLRREVEQYDGEVARRMLVKPGITGLWQVSGRSDLSWDESVRLDLSYVENWSLVGDVLIILKTVRAVGVGSGAY
ncbi:sugar transferase [Millisia brevis]|uniref:sugar transferase n=1 Tax=Millisia brevis TaxID=264148 RepID=UPI001FE21C0A|nr:sugar transferase [Millisia brevis]